MKTQSFYVYDKNIFENGFFKNNITFNLSRMNIDNIHLYHQLHLNNMACVDKNNYFISNSKKKVLFIGDSFTSGMDCPHSWFELLKIKTNNYLSLFNFGMPGTGPSNWIEKLDMIKLLNPDIIIICMVDNILFRPKINFFTDPQEEIIFCQYDGFIETYCKGLIYKNLQFNLSTSERSYLSEIFSSRVTKELNSPNISKNLNSNLLYKNKEYLQQLLEISNNNIIFQFPSLKSFDNPTEFEIHDNIINGFTDRTISINNIRNEMHKYKKENLYMDFHWNLLGNNITANIINKEINLILKSIT